ncbi:glycoside hydrolase [Clavulina sp. PMI_390]|nr:glycoside hydrolase [Clavulina sp. PMI_390]
MKPLVGVIFLVLTICGVRADIGHARANRPLERRHQGHHWNKRADTNGTTTAAISTSYSTTATSSATSAPATTSDIYPPPKYVNGDGDWAQAVAQARSFVASLTTAEKVNLTTGQDTGSRCIGNTGTVPRIGFNGLCFEDGPLGVRSTDNNSAFPAGVNAATTWDRDLILQRGVAMGEEFRGKGVNVALGPMMNLARNAAAGRNWEGCGADPFMCGVVSVSTINGIQSTGVIAVAKHYALNDQEHYRGQDGDEAYSSNEDDRSFHELQLWPFAESVKAGVASVMCAYNKLNQTSACENRAILNDILKEELDFQGFVVSDWAGIISPYGSVMNGTDVNMPGFVKYGNAVQTNPVLANNSYWGANLLAAVQNGTIPEARLDDMVVRMMAAYYKLDQQDRIPPVNFDYATSSTTVNGVVVNEHVNVQSDHYKLIREIGAASAVLLKNENRSLPLDLSKISILGVFGNDAGPNPNGPNSCSSRNCDSGTLAMGWGSGTANFPYLIDPLAAITNYVGNNSLSTQISSVLSDTDYASINATAATADTCLVFVNADSGEKYITVEGNVGDRNDLYLWHNGDTLIESVAANCANTIVVMHIVGPVLVEAWADHPNVTAIINAGIPGQETGNAIVDVLTGAVNPSGKLVYTMAKQRSDYASDILYVAEVESAAYTPQINYTEKLLLDYRWFDANNITPRYEFGFGLSYTTFAYSSLSVSGILHAVTEYSTSLASRKGNSIGGPSGLYDCALTATYSIHNSGAYDGHEVSQLYLSFPESAGEPIHVLRGFERTWIEKGKNAQVQVSLRVKDIAIWDVITQSWVVPTGKFTVWVGASSRNLPLSKTFII